jgi:ABC-type glycerol-3-phosphate transport system substrate-binding protein
VQRQATPLEFWMPGAASNAGVDGFLAQLQERASWVKPNLVLGKGFGAVQTATAAGTPPDIGNVLIGELGTMFAVKLHENAADALKGQPGWAPDTFTDGLRTTMSEQGRMAVVPVTTNSSVILLRTESLQRAGLKVPDATWTWDDMAEYATRLTVRSGSETTQWGIQGPYMANFDASNQFNSILHSFGGRWTDAEGKKAAFQGPEGIAALEWMVDVIYRKKASPVPWPDNWLASTTPEPSLFAFTLGSNGGVAMMRSESGAYTNLVNAMGTMPWEQVVFPRKVRQAAHQSAGSWFLVKGAPHREAAVETLRIMSLPEVVAQWSATVQSLPATLPGAAHATYQAFLRQNPRFNTYWEAAKHGVTYGGAVGFGDLRVAVAEAVASAITGEVSARDALTEAARKADAGMARARGEG